MKSMLWLPALATMVLVVISGCVQTNKETACQTDADCDCGVHIQTKECVNNRCM